MMGALWRAFLEVLSAPLSLWRSSLLARTVTITVGLSGLAVTLIGGYMSLTIADNLFSGRTSQIVNETTRAATAAQALFDNSVTAAGRHSLTRSTPTPSSSTKTRVSVWSAPKWCALRATVT
jgi:two-component system sensor histidine kinase MtrB